MGSSIQYLWEHLDSYAATRLLVLLFTLYYVASIVYSLWLHPLSKYPGPFTSRISNLPRMARLITGNEMPWVVGMHKQYGKVVRVGPNELSYTSLQAQTDIYGSGSKVAGRKWPGFYTPKFTHSQSILFTRDDGKHARQRRTFAPAFSDKALQDQAYILTDLASLLVKRLKQRVSRETDKGNPDDAIIVDMVQAYMFLTFDVIGELAFGGSFQMTEKNEHVAWIKKPFDSVKLGCVLVSRDYFPIVRPLIDALFWLGKSTMQVPYDFTINLVDKRLADKRKRERLDLWDFVLKSQELDGSKYEKTSRSDIHANAFLFLLAGTETSSTALSGLTFILLSNPDKLKKLVTEIRTSFATPEEITLTNLRKLKYLDNCIEEGMRMYPPVPVGLPRDMPPGGARIGDEWVGEGTVVYFTQHAAFRSDTNFRDPDQFIPERWSSQEYQTDNKSLMQPFGIGHRNCIGQTLAYHEMRLFLSTVLYHFDLELVDKEQDWLNQKTYIAWDRIPLMVKVKLAE